MAQFSLKKKQQPVEIETEDGTVLTYTLLELSGAQRNQYLNIQNKRVATKRGEQEIKSFDGLCSDLLCMCLYHPSGTSVTVADVNNWPSEMQMDIYKMAVKLSGLDKDAKEDAEKNS